MSELYREEVMMKQIENCDYAELKARLQWQLSQAIFDGTMDRFIDLAIDWSIRWGDQQRANEVRSQKYVIPDHEPVRSSGLSKRAKNVLLSKGLRDASRVRDFITNRERGKEYDPPYGVRVLRLLSNCGAGTAKEIVAYYEEEN